MTYSKRRAILGGRFDPLHVGHLEVAVLSLMTGLIDEVVFVPTGDPPHKSVVAPFEYRYEMVRIATFGIPQFKVVDWERNQRYAIGIWNNYAREHDWYLLGGDSFNTILSWYQYDELVKLVNFMIVPRPMVTIRRDLLSVINKFVITNPCHISVSSTDIRTRIKQGLPIKGLVPDDIIEYIYHHRLYGGENVGR